MKTIVEFLLFLICILPFMGCSGDEIEEDKELVTSEYYVKYCYGGVTSNRAYHFSVQYTGVSNGSTKQFVSSYEGYASKISDEKICGPFKYGDCVSLRMSGSLLNTFLEIYISKDNSPFALKKYGTEFIDYTIDY